MRVSILIQCHGHFLFFRCSEFFNLYLTDDDVLQKLIVSLLRVQHEVFVVSIMFGV